MDFYYLGSSEVLENPDTLLCVCVCVCVGGGGGGGGGGREEVQEGVNIGIRI